MLAPFVDYANEFITTRAASQLLVVCLLRFIFCLLFVVDCATPQFALGAFDIFWLWGEGVPKKRLASTAQYGLANFA